MTRGRIVDAKTRLDATIKLVRLVVLVCQTKTIKASVKLTAHRISKVVPKIPSGTLLLGPSTINVAAVRSKTGIKRVAMIKTRVVTILKYFSIFSILCYTPILVVATYSADKICNCGHLSCHFFLAWRSQ